MSGKNVVGFVLNRFTTPKHIIRLLIKVSLMLLLPVALGPTATSQVAAQGGVEIKGTEVSAAQSVVVNVAELAQQQASVVLNNATWGHAVPFPAYNEPGGVSERKGLRDSSAPAQPSVASPAPNLNYTGLGDIAANGFFSIPPDTMGAVGITRTLDTLNNNYRVQEKSTGTTVSTVTMNNFWAGTGATKLFDPKTLYDPYNNRFIVVAVANSNSITSSIEVGVSTGPDPNGTFTLHRFQICSLTNPCGGGTTDWWADYPTVGFNKNWVAIAVNMFTNSSDVFQESRLLVVNYPLLRTGVLAATLFTGIADFTVQPCVTYSNTENTLYAPNHGSSSSATYRLNTITGIAVTPIFTQGTLKAHTLAPLSGGWVNPGSVADILPQAQGSAGVGDVASINQGDARILKCTFRNNQIWYSQTIGLPAGGPIARLAAQWVKLDPGGNDADGGRVDDPTATATNGGKWYAYPTLSVNANNDVLMGFSQFASNQWPSAGYVLRYGSDAAGTMRDPLIYKAGEGMYWKTFNCGNPAAENRWGDYSATMVDPVDDTSLWTLQEYSQPEGSVFAATGCNSGVWGTWWAKVVPVNLLPIHLFLPIVKR